METSNQFNPRCVCGGSTENPNDDCERCQLLAELARLKSEKEAADKQLATFDQFFVSHCFEREGDVTDRLREMAEFVEKRRRDAWSFMKAAQESRKKLTAATSRAETLEKERGARADAVSEIIDCLRCVLLQPGNADYEQDARAAIKEYLALLQPAKEVEGGK